MSRINSLFYFLIIIFLFNNFHLKASENKNLISIGNNDAKVIVKVFSSLTCPHCANFHDKIFYKLIGGLKSSMGYLGAKKLNLLRTNPKFVKITKAGFYESMVHNIDEIKK